MPGNQSESFSLNRASETFCALMLDENYSTDSVYWTGKEESVKVPPPGQYEQLQLTRRQMDIINVMLELNSDCFEARETQAKITRSVDPHLDPASLKHVFLKLKRTGMIASKKGADGGVWLTDKGMDYARRLEAINSRHG